jgi:low temperature requirement protein LtrA
MTGSNSTRRGPRLTLRPLADFGADRHASWLELFFDLIFVLVVSQVALELSNDLTVTGFLRFVLLFILPWWAWVGYTFYADRFESDRDVVYRLMMIGGMMAVAALAVNVHGAFHGRALAFVMSYVAVRAVLLLLYARTWFHVHLARELSAAYMKGGSLSIAIWLGSLLVPEPARYWLWAAGVLVDLLTPLVSRRALLRTPYDASHIPERFGLFTIIVIGDTVIAATNGMSTTEWQTASVLAAACGFAITAALWWVYFEFIETCGVANWRKPGQPYIFAHLPVVLGLTVAGVGLRHITAEALTGTLTEGTRWSLAGGIAIYLASLLTIRVVSGKPKLTGMRVAVAGVAVAIAAFGEGLSPLALVGTLLLLLVLQIALETSWPAIAHASDGAPEPDAAERAIGPNIPMRECRHVELIDAVTPSADGCEECLALGERWVEARLCLICGHVGCCDTSKNRHAWKHFQETGHPLIESFEPGNKWQWCYIDETYHRVSSRSEQES